MLRYTYTIPSCTMPLPKESNSVNYRLWSLHALTGIAGRVYLHPRALQTNSCSRGSLRNQKSSLERSRKCELLPNGSMSRGGEMHSRLSYNLPYSASFGVTGTGGGWHETRARPHLGQCGHSPRTGNSEPALRHTWSELGGEEIDVAVSL